jgi:hypothetical protein
MTAQYQRETNLSMLRALRQLTAAVLVQEQNSGVVLLDTRAAEQFAAVSKQSPIKIDHNVINTTLLTC